MDLLRWIEWIELGRTVWDRWDGYNGLIWFRMSWSLNCKGAVSYIALLGVIVLSLVVYPDMLTIYPI